MSYGPDIRSTFSNRESGAPHPHKDKLTGGGGVKDTPYHGGGGGVRQIDVAHNHVLRISVNIPIKYSVL